MPQSYMVAKADHPDKLTVLVNRLLKDGWRTEGGVSACYDPTGMRGQSVLYSQALTKTDSALETKAFQRADFEHG